MNDKKAKKIRRELRAVGVDPTQKNYELNLGGQVVLTALCGRAIYQAAKHVAE